MLSARFSAGWPLTLVRTPSAARCNIVKKILIGIAVIGALLGGPALAADLEAPPPPTPPYSSWSGPYIGLGVGTRFNAVDANVTSATVGTPPTAISLPPETTGGNPLEFWRSRGPSGMAFIDNIALRTGIYAGWNFQVSPSYVVGVEADFGWANESAAIHGSPYPTSLLFGTPSLPFGATPNDGFFVRTTWDSSARLRVGWLVFPSTMLYLTGGVAWAHLQVMSSCAHVFTPNVSNCTSGNYFSGTLGPYDITHSDTKLGWTAGAGIDVSLGPRWVVRGQYRFSDFGYLSGAGAFNFTDVRVCSGCSAANNPLTVSYQLLLVQHHFEIGLAYKFW
jgi:outer membrane immunogenic protein